VAAPRTVLLLHSSSGRYGADLQLLAIASGIDRARWRPLCVLPEAGELAKLLDDAGVEVLLRPLAVLRRAGMGPRGLARLAASLARDSRELGALAAERRAAIVHSNTSVVLGGTPAARRAGAASLVHVREIYAGAASGPAAALWPLLRRRLERADALACVSRAVADQFGRRAFVLNDGLLRVPEPTDRAEARARLGLRGDAFCVALLGRISDWKGQDVLARALADHRLGGVVGLVAGDPYPGNESAERDLRALAEALGVADRLVLLGFRDDVETVLGAADVVVVPSTRPDPLPNSALEAAAAGLPVVAADHGGLPEIVRHGETGLLVRPGDPGALAAAIAGLAANPKRARSLGAAAARDARERFSLGRMVSALEERYEQLSGRA